MGAERPRLGVLAGAHLPPNLHAFLGNLGEILGSTFTCDIIAGDGEMPARIRDGFTLSPYRDAWPWSAVAACVSYARRHRPMALLAAGRPQTLGLAVVIAGRLTGTPAIVRMTGESFDQVPLARGAMARAKAGLVHGAMARLAFRHADHVIAVGATLRDDLLARVRRPAGTVALLPQPVDLRRFQPAGLDEKRRLRRRHGLDPDRRTVLFVGRLSHFKGADRLIDMAARVGAASRAVQFCVVGRGEYEEPLRALGAGLVHLAGAVGHDVIHDTYRMADLLVLPSRTEGLPNVVLEALASGLPVIAAPVGDIPNWVSNLATEGEDYARRILAGDWVVDALPKSMTWEAQQAAYITYFRSVCGLPE